LPFDRRINEIGVGLGQQLIRLDQQSGSGRPPFIFGGIGAERGVLGIDEALVSRQLKRTPTGIVFRGIEVVRRGLRDVLVHRPGHFFTLLAVRT
jgi:hypothetical protein